MSTDSLKVWHRRQWRSALMEKKQNKTTKQTTLSDGGKPEGRTLKIWSSTKWSNISVWPGVLGGRLVGCFCPRVATFQGVLKPAGTAHHVPVAFWQSDKNPVCSNVATVYFSRAAICSLFGGYIRWKWEGLPANQPTHVSQATVRGLHALDVCKEQNENVKCSSKSSQHKFGTESKGTNKFTENLQQDAGGRKWTPDPPVMKISAIFSPCGPLLVMLSWEMDVMSVLHNHCDWLIRLLAVWQKIQIQHIFWSVALRLDKTRTGVLVPKYKHAKCKPSNLQKW